MRGRYGLLRLALSLAAALALSGCLAPSQPTGGGTRDPEVSMSSIAVLDLQKFAGRWYEVEAFVPEGASCVLGAVTFTPQRDGSMTLTEGPCADGAPRTGLARPIGPGRFAFEGDEIWVLWVDATYHTAVIGSPNGAAHVLSREMTLPADRQIAVHGILSWNGYDVSQLSPARRR